MTFPFAVPRALALLTIVCFVLPLGAQTPQWAFSFGSTQFDRAYGIELDPAGNVYICGAFDDDVDMDPDPVDEAILSDLGNGDVYLAKYSNAGEHLWSMQLGNYFHDLGSDIAVDDAGNVYVTGYFRIDVDFDPGPGEAILSALSSRDVFVAKYDTDGNYLWAMNHAYGGNVERYPAIGLDAAGNVLITGEFFGSPDFDPGPGTGIITANGTNGSQDIYLAKYTADGAFLWARSMGGPEFDRGMDVVADTQGNIYVTGMFRGTADFDGGPGSALLTAGAEWDGFLAKYDGAGNHLWSFPLGESGMDLAMDPYDNVYVVGFYTGGADMDPGPGTAYLANGPETNGFMAKYDESGAHLWSYGLADGGEGQCNAVAVDATGYVYITGYFDGVVDFDPGPGEALLVGWDFYAAKYDAEGNHVWSFDAGDTAYDGGWGIAVDDSANVYSTGVFYGTIDMDPDTGSYELVSNGGRDVFVAKHAPCATSLQSVDLCAGGTATLPDGSEVDSPGMYPITFPADSCETVLITEVLLIDLDPDFVQQGNTLIANETDATYQWLDCGNGNSEIPGATMQSYTTEVSGSYALRITREGCTATSECQDVISTGLAPGATPGLRLHPNPATERVHISTTGTVRSVELWDLSGQRVEAVYRQGVLDVQHLAPGIYRVVVRLQNGIAGSAMLVKQ